MQLYEYDWGKKLEPAVFQKMCLILGIRKKDGPAYPMLLLQFLEGCCGVNRLWPDKNPVRSDIKTALCSAFLNFSRL